MSMASIVNPEVFVPVNTMAVEHEKATDVSTATNYVVVEVVLRVLLFATTLTSVVVIATGKQTKLIPIPFPPYGVPISAKFTDSPAFIYFIAALSVACLYSIISTLVSFFALMKPSATSKKLMSHFVVIEVLLLGIVASAAGAAAAVAYIGLRGNSHVQWNKICNVYDSFCRHLAFSVLSSLIASVVLCFLILVSIFTLSRKTSK